MKRIVDRGHGHSASSEQSRQSTRHRRLVVYRENLATFERGFLRHHSGAGRCGQAGSRSRRADRRRRSRRWHTHKTLSQREEQLRDRHAVDLSERLARESLGQVASDLRSFFESELSRHFGDILRVPLGRGLEIGGQAGVEQRDCRVVELVDLLESGSTGAIPRRGYGGRDVLSMRCLGGQNRHATHSRELSQHLFHVDGCQEEAIDVDFLQRVQRGLRLLHGDRECNPHIVAGVFGATDYVDGISCGESVAEQDQAGIADSRGLAHLRSVVKLADDDATEPESDLANYFRGYSPHQEFDGVRHLLRNIPLRAERRRGNTILGPT